MARAPTIAVLAGGLATRLGELTRQVPKSLLDVHGRPFLAWQLELFAASGLRDVVLCTGHHGEQIEAWVAHSAPPGMRIRFSGDGGRQLGTGGALRQALPLLGDTFLVTYGDSYLRCDYLAVYRHFLTAAAAESPGPLGLMTVFRNDDRYDASNVVFERGQITRYDKRERIPEMHHIDWGLGVLRPQAFDAFADPTPLDLAAIYGALVARRQLAGLEMSERFYEIGSPSGLDEFRRYAAAVQG